MGGMIWASGALTLFVISFALAGTPVLFLVQWAAIAQLGLLGAAMGRLGELPGPRRIVWMCFALALTAAAIPQWEVAGLVALVGFRLGGLADRQLLDPRVWSRGRIPLWTAAVAPAPPIFALLWFALTKPDLTDIAASPVPVPLQLVAALPLSILRAGLFEIAWRGVLHRELRDLYGSRMGLAVGAVAFSVHYAYELDLGLVGWPVALAWGLVLGRLREEAGGLLAPTLVHTFAWTTITWGAIVLTGAIR
jgi:Type II CAAX prenyl endopeptidase Rce1-like